MAFKKNKLAATLLGAMVLSSPAYADIVIISQHEPSINNDVIEEKVEPRHEAESMNTVDFIDLPLSFVVNTLKTEDWDVSYQNGTENAVVSWKGTNKNWQDIIKFITIDNDMHADINHPAKRIVISRSLSPTQPKPRSNKAVEETADEMMSCMSIGCEKPTISIEKLAIDNSWFSSEAIKVANLGDTDTMSQKEDSDKTTPIFEGIKQDAEKEIAEVSDLELKEKAFDIALERKHAEREEMFREQFKNAVIFHGKGTFEEFVNGGGAIGLKEADPNTPYTYVFKKGTLFDTIDTWSAYNNFTVKNDIKTNLGKNYRNIADIYIYGTYLDVTRNLLDRYKHADYPVNHQFYTQGNVLHIFGDKYDATTFGGRRK